MEGIHRQAAVGEFASRSTACDRAVSPQWAPDGAQPHYERQRPQQTTLYRVVQQHAASYFAQTEANIGSELQRQDAASSAASRHFRLDPRRLA